MTPRFTQYVDPIIEQVIDLLLAVEARRTRSGKGEWDSLNAKLQRAERELLPTQGRAWELAKFALVAWIDESVRNTEGWSGREWWLNNPLEYHHFKSLGDSHEMFFVNAREAENLANGDDAFETFYVCGLLGFRGFYGHGEPTDPERVKLAATKFGLPRSFADWVSENGRIIRERRKLGTAAASAEPRERRIITAKPMWSPMLLLWPWLLVAILTGLNVVVAFHTRR